MSSTPRQTTVSSVIDDLRSKKQDHEFLMTHQGLSAGKGKFYSPNELRIIRTYTFDEKSNPSYSSILHLIETNDGLKGYSLDAYGSYRNNKDDVYKNFINKISAEKKKEVL